LTVIFALNSPKHYCVIYASDGHYFCFLSHNQLCSQDYPLILRPC